jgi:hypothetical protein
VYFSIGLDLDLNQVCQTYCADVDDMCTWVPLVGEYTTREKLIPTHHKGLSTANLGSPVTYTQAVMSGIKVIPGEPEKVRLG